MNNIIMQIRKKGQIMFVKGKKFIGVIDYKMMI